MEEALADFFSLMYNFPCYRVVGWWIVMEVVWWEGGLGWLGGVVGVLEGVVWWWCGRVLVRCLGCRVVVGW